MAGAAGGRVSGTGRRRSVETRRGRSGRPPRRSSTCAATVRSCAHHCSSCHRASRAWSASPSRAVPRRRPARRPDADPRADDRRADRDACRVARTRIALRSRVRRPGRRRAGHRHLLDRRRRRRPARHGVGRRDRDPAPHLDPVAGRNRVRVVERRRHEHPVRIRSRLCRRRRLGDAPAGRGLVGRGCGQRDAERLPRMQCEHLHDEHHGGRRLGHARGLGRRRRRTRPCCGRRPLRRSGRRGRGRGCPRARGDAGARRATAPTECEVVLPLATVRSISGMRSPQNPGSAAAVGATGPRRGSRPATKGATGAWATPRRPRPSIGCATAGGVMTAQSTPGTFAPVTIAGLGADDLAAVRCDPAFGPSCSVDLALGPDSG